MNTQRDIMRASDCRVLKKMEVRCSILVLKLMLFQILVVWCSAKHVTLDGGARLQVLTDLDGDVQDSIRNLIHTGIYSHKHLDTSQVQVTVPVKVTRDGALVSHELTHEHGHGHARARRDLHGREHELDHNVFYNVTIDGRELRLDLRPSVTFITPAMVVERHTDSGRTRRKPRREATSCHYTGSIRGQPTSSIALSACDGLAGLLRTDRGEYWIEPSKEKLSENSLGRPHVVFKRSAVDNVAAFHRNKREIQKTNQNRNYGDRKFDPKRYVEARRHYENKEAMDKRRLENLRRLEAMRNNPIKYRRQQMRTRMEQRRNGQRINNNSVESKSNEQSVRMRNNYKKIARNERDRVRPRRGRRKKRSKNCATKQPKYQWGDKASLEEFRLNRRRNRNKRRNRHHRLSQSPGYQGERRSTRSVSKPRHVEVLLVADKLMTDFHNDSLETYLLSIMNMVSSLYMDPSIGNYIKVVVVKIIMIEHAERTDLNVTSDADKTLSSFCRWQENLNPDDDSNPHHHDVAILITRIDLSSSNDNSTLGVANVAGMCKPHLSCSINEDNGIALAHTITHELGHNFGLFHDTEEIGCHNREGSTLHIMTPFFEIDSVQVSWSRCSKRDVTNFLDAGLGECLSDIPSQKEYEYPDQPAGVLFDAEMQCNLQFNGGGKAEVCEPGDMCQYLWCVVDGMCRTNLRPAASGTTCGPNMWCQNLTCVPKGPTPEPRNGDWGPWSEWSECSRSCGAGVSMQTRECNNPEPLNNGAYCIGDRSRYKICNTDPCPLNDPQYREVQCSKFNNATSEWVAYFDQDRPCDLQCIPKSGNYAFEVTTGFVADGTPCRQSIGSRDMCITGICYKVGCDWVVGSDKEEDSCGVCGGDGSACKTVKGIYNKSVTRYSGLSEVAVIPAGSRNVKIEEKVNRGNYIAIKSAKTRKTYINGTGSKTMTEYFVAGTPAIYERDRDWEKVRIVGPLAEDIKVYQKIFRGRYRNPGVTYQYTVDSKPPKPRFHFQLSNWTACSVSCGQGYMVRRYQCVDEQGRPVERRQCYQVESPRHEALVQKCKQPACPDSHVAPPVNKSPYVNSSPYARNSPHAQNTPYIQKSHTASQSNPNRHAPSQANANRNAQSQTSTHRNLPQTEAPYWKQNPSDTYWWAGKWMPCTQPCHMPGAEALRHRSVYCVIRSSNQVTNDSKCDMSRKPTPNTKCTDVPAC